MDQVTLTTILGILAVPLGAVATGLSIVIGVVMSRWQAQEKTKSALIEAQEKLKIMKINGENYAKYPDGALCITNNSRRYGTQQRLWRCKCSDGNESL